MPEDTIASAAWRTWASVMPQPKLFQLFQPIGGVTAGLPGAACATGCAVTVANATRTAAARCGSFLDRTGIGAPFWCSARVTPPGRGSGGVGPGRSAGRVGLGQQAELPGQLVVLTARVGIHALVQEAELARTYLH